MLTRMQVRRFRKLGDVDIDLGDVVVFVGPNNSGKTAALQALSLWEAGTRRWLERRSGKATPKQRSGVSINRRDLISIPVPQAKLLWHNLHVRDVSRPEGKQQTQNVRIEVIVDGVTGDTPWQWGLEFDYANDESFYCRPVGGASRGASANGGGVPHGVADVRVAYLPPMSGLAADEPVLEPGRVRVLIGEGQTAQVLRNLCYQIYSGSDGAAWDDLKRDVKGLFGVSLRPPEYIVERGEIVMSYDEQSGLRLDLSASGRGLQQTLLLLTHLYANPGAVLLLDEPDAHLEILRQREVYQLISDTARRNGGQVVIASHSEVVLNEAGDRDVVVAFVGRPHRIDDRGSQLLKSLKEIGFEDYYQAEQAGWVLYLEGSTDLAMLRAFARTLGHPAAATLDKPFVRYVGNQPQKARDHFYGLREAKDDLVGIAIFDRLSGSLNPDGPLAETMWRRRELENYLCTPEVLLRYVTTGEGHDLFSDYEARRNREVMSEVVAEVEQAQRVRRQDAWSDDIKASDEVLDLVFANYFERLGLPNRMAKSDYHVLAELLGADEIPEEIGEKLDLIVATSSRATPRTS